MSAVSASVAKVFVRCSLLSSSSALPLPSLSRSSSARSAATFAATVRNISSVPKAAATVLAARSGNTRSVVVSKTSKQQTNQRQPQKQQNLQLFPATSFSSLTSLAVPGLAPSPSTISSILHSPTVPQFIIDDVSPFVMTQHEAKSDADIDDIEELHLHALRNQQKTYIDPATGFTVFTEMMHLKRGTCCGNKCRHCPYGYSNVYQEDGDDYVTITKAKVQSGDFDEAHRLYQGILNGDEDVIQYLTSKAQPQLQSETKVMDGNERYGNGNGNDERPSHNDIINVSVDRNVKSAKVPTTKKTPKVTDKNVPYTRTGDGGTSQLLSGERRSKCDCNFEALGTVDELCAVVGVVHAHLLDKMNNGDSEDDTLYGNLPTLLLDVMSRLFDIGSHVAKPRISTGSDDESVGQENKDRKKTKFVSNGVGDGFDARHIDDLEAWIDEMTDELPELTSFILPTGAVAAAQLHVARTTCRRAERRVVPLVVDDQTCDPNALRYLNRLSDFFFVAARWVNFCEGKGEIQYRRSASDNTQRERVHSSLN